MVDPVVVALLAGVFLARTSKADWERWRKRWSGDHAKPDDDKGPPPKRDEPDGPPKPPPDRKTPPATPPASFPLDALPGGVVPYSPPPAAVVARAMALLGTLGKGKVSKEPDPTGTWSFVAYRKEPHAAGKVGVSAYRSTTKASAAEPPPGPPAEKKPKEPNPDDYRNPDDDTETDSNGPPPEGWEPPPYKDPMNPDDPTPPFMRKPPWESATWADVEKQGYGQTAGGGLTAHPFGGQSNLADFLDSMTGDGEGDLGDDYADDGLG